MPPASNPGLGLPSTWEPRPCSGPTLHMEILSPDSVTQGEKHRLGSFSVDFLARDSEGPGSRGRAVINGLINGGQAAPQGSRHRVQRVSVLSPLLSPPHLTPTSSTGRRLGACAPESAPGAGSGQGVTWVTPPRAAGEPGCSSVRRGPGVTGGTTGAGTRGAQAAVRCSVLVVLLLLELGHQAEFTAAAALGKIQHHVLWGRGEMEPVKPPFAQALPPPQTGVGPQKGLSSSFSLSFSLGPITHF